MRYDAVVIGSGVGGYSTAISLARNGLRVAIIEKHLVGGECVNYGCVPSKVFYNLAEAIRTIEKYDGEWRINWSSIVRRAQEIIDDMRSGLKYLFDGYGIDLYEGYARLRAGGRIVIDRKEVEAERIVIATGTDPKPLPLIGFDGERIINNRHIYSLEEKPDRILIIGGGVIGVETAYYLSKLGVETTIIEAEKHILPSMDLDVAATLRGFLKEHGVRIYEKCLVNRVEPSDEEVRVKASCIDGEIVVDKVFIAIGRKPNTNNIGLEENNIEVDNRGFIKIREGYETSNPKILAVGDVTGGVLLAHKAIVEGIYAAENILYVRKKILNPLLTPKIFFTGLEIAYIGYTERELRGRGIRYSKKRIPLTVLAAVRIKTGKRGYVKILHDRDDVGKIYGVEIVAPNASEIISLYLPLLSDKYQLDLYTMAKTPLPHLTVAESLREIAEYLIGEPIHYLMRK